MTTCPACGCQLGRTVKTPIDRSLGFTAMLELYPGFGQMPDTEGMGITTAFLEDWYRSGHTGMFEYAREWVAARQRPAETFCGTCGHLDTPGVHTQPDCPRADLASCGHPRNEDGECGCSSWPERAPVPDPEDEVRQEFARLRELEDRRAVVRRIGDSLAGE